MGLSTISPYEVKKEPMKKDLWAEPVALSACIPHDIDSEVGMSHVTCYTYHM